MDDAKRQADRGWHAAPGGEEVGPLTPAELRKLAASGRLAPSDPVWRTGGRSRREAGTIAGLFPPPAAAESTTQSAPKSNQTPATADRTERATGPKTSGEEPSIRRSALWSVARAKRIRVVLGLTVPPLAVAVFVGAWFGFRGSGTSRVTPEAVQPAPSLPEHTGLVGVGVSRADGQIVVSSLTLGSPAAAKGVRLGDRLCGVGRTRSGIIDLASKTEDQVVDLLRGQAKETVWLRYQSQDAARPVDVEIARCERFDETKEYAITWRSTGYSTVVPREIVEQFPGSPRKYAFFDNQSKLTAFPDRYAGERIAVVTDLLFPEVTSAQLRLRMFGEMDSPVGLVNRSQAPDFFAKLVNNNPTVNRWVVMHLRLRQYRDAPTLYGEVEEVMFLDGKAPDCYRPLILDQIQAGGNPPENMAVNTPTGEPHPAARPELETARDKPAGPDSYGDLPFSLDDLVKILGRPDQRNDTAILYSGKLKATRTNVGIDVAFSTGNDGLFFAAGLFTSRLFTKGESDQIIDFLDEIGGEKTIGRFKVRVRNATEPRGWRQAGFAPRE